MEVDDRPSNFPNKSIFLFDSALLHTLLQVPQGGEGVVISYQTYKLIPAFITHVFRSVLISNQFFRNLPHVALHEFNHSIMNHVSTRFQIPRIVFLLIPYTFLALQSFRTLIENLLDYQHRSIVLSSDWVDECFRIPSKQTEPVNLPRSKLPQKLFLTIDNTAALNKIRIINQSSEFIHHQFLWIFLNKFTNSGVHFANPRKWSQEPSFDELLHNSTTAKRRKFFTLRVTRNSHRISDLSRPQVCLKFMIHVLFPIEIVIIRPQPNLNMNAIRFLRILFPFLKRKFIKFPLRFFPILAPFPCFEHIRPILKHSRKR